jgi:Arc/MetJ-type ribon-helix-helix transcriptional regulator
MSKVVSFKAPDEMVENIDESVEKGNFTSRGEFLRNLVRNIEDKRLSQEAKEDIEEARNQEGKPIDEL